MRHSISMLGAILAISTIATGQILVTKCYYKTDGKILASSGHPCGVITPVSNYTSCCEVTDTCLEDGLCHYTRAEPPPPSVVARYYVGGCTDPSYNSTTCQTACGDINPSDVVYNQSLNIWSCCGQTNGTIHCEDPTTEIFSAPAPSDFSATYTVPSTVITSSAPSSTVSSTLTSTTTSSASATPSATPTSKSSSPGLTTGAQAGIGIGAAIGGIAVLARIGFFFVRRTRAGRASVAQEDSMKDYPRYQDNGANPLYQRNGDTSWNAGSTYGQESGPSTWNGTPENSGAALQKNARKAGNGEPVEKMADSTLATMQMQELGNDGLGRGRGSRYEMQG